MSVFKPFLNLLLLSTVMFAVGCVADSAKKEEVTGAPEIINRLLGNNISPSSFPAKTESIITLSYTSVDNQLASSCSISQLNQISVTSTCGCNGAGVCSVGVKGIGAYTGPASFAFNVVAGGKTSTTGRANFTISQALPGSNFPPTISSISFQTTTEGLATGAIAFTIADSDSIVNCSNVSAASSNTTVVPVANIVISGASPTCYVRITPAANQIGLSNITLTLTDNGSPLPAATAATTFALNVTAFNDPPVISTIGTQGTLEDIPSTPIAFTISDVDSVLTCAGSVTAASSNTALVANASITIAGTAPNCTVTLAPNLNQSGATTITLTLRDNGTPLPSKSVTTSFTFGVVPANDAPTISNIATQSTTENVAKTVSFTIADVDSGLTCAGSVTGISTNTTLVPNTNISISGAAPNCIATVTPANAQSGSTNLTFTVTDNGYPLPAQTTNTSFIFTVAHINHAPTISSVGNQVINEDSATSAIPFTINDTDSTLYCTNVVATSNNTILVPNGNIVVSGTAPNCLVTVTPVANGYGSLTVNLTVTDNGTPLPALTATTNFNVTVSPVNDTPTLSTITDRNTGEGTPTAPIAFTVNDLDSTLSCTSGMTATSSNTTLVPNTNIIFGGIAPDCTVVVTPVAGLNGSAAITLTLADNGTPLPALTTTTTFNLTVSQVNHAPVISAITNKTTDEDTTITGINFTISDSDSTVYCNNVTGVSSNAAVVSSANIVITGTAPNCIVTITPLANVSGSTTITLTLTDNGTPPPSLTANSVFGLTVTAVNDAPAISAITNKSTEEDTPTNSIAFTINDIDSNLTCNGSVVGTSSNTTLIPNANIVITGTAPNCSAVITPGADEFGNATITLTLTDNGTPMPGLTATSSFGLAVSSVPDLTGTLTVNNNLSGIASSYSVNSYARALKFTGLISDEALTSVEVCLGTASGACDVSSWVEATGYTVSGTTPPVILGGAYRMKSGIGGAQDFALLASCGATNSYYYSIRATGASTKVSHVISTPAWSFWEPSCLGSSTLSMWMDANEPTTFTIPTANNISEWRDKSGNGRKLTQGSSTKQPFYIAAALGTGYPGVKFDGVQSAAGGDSLTLPSGSFVYDHGATTVFSVLIAPAINQNRYIFGEGSSTNANVSYTPFTTSTTNQLTGHSLNNANAAEITLPASSSVLFNNTVKLGMIEDSGSTFYTYSNGVAQSQGIFNYVRSTSTVTTFRLGARFRNNAEGGWINGSIGEFIVTNGVLSTLNRTKLEGYAAHKWGVSANLPAGHAYKTTPP